MIELSLEFKTHFLKHQWHFGLSYLAHVSRGIPERSTSQTAWSRLCDVNVKLH